MPILRLCLRSFSLGSESEIPLICLRRIAQAMLGVGLNFIPYSGESVSTVGREVLGDTHLRQKIRFQINHILRAFPTVKFTEKSGSTFGDGGI